MILAIEIKIEEVAIVISCIALLFSLFSFYWNQFHRANEFYLLIVSGIGNMKTPEFALVNGGKTDILVTNLWCSFEHADQSTRSVPRQHVDNAASLNLIAAGKSVRCRMIFPEPFDFVEKGQLKEDDITGNYLMDMWVDVEWIDSKGGQHTRAYEITQYGFDKSGEFRSCMGYKNKKFDLYRMK